MQLKRLILPAGLAALAAAQPRVTIQECTPGYAPESFVVNADGTVKQGSLCVDFDSSSLILAQCSGSDNQVWTFHPDGTVQNKAQSNNCWNADGGSTSAGTRVVMYQCGVKDVAANDVFWPLPASQQILANESGLCLSTAVPPYVCEGDMCCSLNGVYAGGKCTCFAPWTGTNCSSFDVLPVPRTQGYGMKPNVTSWGGNIINVNGTFHLYVAEMVNHCPLSDWGSNSRCSHATASTIEGPYTYVDTAVDVWCHNPHVMTQTVGGQTVYALFHIGDGTGGNPKNCNSSVVEMSASNAYAAAAGGGAGSKAQGSTLHIATSPYGPWTPVNPAPPGCNNPAPYLHPNSTWFLLCNGQTIYSAPALTGPWSVVVQVSAKGRGVPGNYEDPFLWMDTRGNWHIIWHVYTTDVPDTCVNSTVSAHYFSPDGLHWTASPYEPFGNSVTFTDGSNMIVSTRERPKLLFDVGGEPTHLVNGVCGGTSYCAPTPCVNCKYDWWDFTLIQPLNV